jgi:hypothetical protein
MSADNNRSIERASRSWVAGSTVALSCGPATISRARGNENMRAEIDNTTTHHAMRHNNNASRGCDANFRPPRKTRPLIFVN